MRLRLGGPPGLRAESSVPPQTRGTRVHRAALQSALVRGGGRPGRPAGGQPCPVTEGETRRPRRERARVPPASPSALFLFQEHFLVPGAATAGRNCSRLVHR